MTPQEKNALSSFNYESLLFLYMGFTNCRLIVLILLLPLPLLAQQGFTQFYTIDNLHSNELIKSVAKDKDGFVWIATDDGVLRYDGYQTQLFFKELSTHYTKGFLKKRNGQFYLLNYYGIK